MRGTGWAALAGSGSGSPRRASERAGGQPGTFLFGAGRSGSCAGVARTLLISQCWDGASWARRGGGGRPQPVPGGGRSSSSSRRGSSSRRSSSGRPAGLPLCLAPRVPGAWRGAEPCSLPPSLLPGAPLRRPPRWQPPRRVGAPRRRCLSGCSLPSRAGKMDPGPPLSCNLKDVKWSAVAVPLDLLVSTYRLPQIARLDSGAWGGERGRAGAGLRAGCRTQSRERPVPLRLPGALSRRSLDRHLPLPGLGARLPLAAESAPCFAPKYLGNVSPCPFRVCGGQLSGACLLSPACPTERCPRRPKLSVEGHFQHWRPGV